jgi:hypothetical protein
MMSARLYGVLGVAMAAMAAMTACARVPPHVDPRPRSPTDAARASVDLHVECVSSLFDGSQIEWRPPSAGRGVIISERYILTVAHVVRCPDHPIVYARLYDGRRVRLYVERDEATFEGKRDGLARLVSPHPLRRFMAPPTLGQGDGVHYMLARRSGTVTGDRHEIARYFGEGDSGVAIYNLVGALVGLLGRGSAHDIEIFLVDDRWLSGT